jgi:hypothetical protein
MEPSDAIGHTVTVERVPFTIIVMPPDLASMSGALSTWRCRFARPL